jgi:hypothetical protein
MSSGFVSGGTIDDPLARGSDDDKKNDDNNKDDEAWRLAQEQLAESQRRKEEAQSANDGKSLYEILQANKGDYISFESLLRGFCVHPG